MEIFANGKNIPTYPFSRLFTQGEHCADTITFVLDRFYNGIDLADCSFTLIGLTEDKWEVNQTLLPIISGEKLKLDWKVMSSFTVNAGLLQLEMRVSRNDELILKFQMRPVFVSPALNKKNEPLPETAEQLISEINNAASEAMEKIQDKIGNLDISPYISELRQTAKQYLSMLDEKMAEFDLDETNARLDKMEETLAMYLARTEVVALTQEEYDSIPHNGNFLYVIIDGSVSS